MGKIGITMCVAFLLSGLVGCAKLDSSAMRIEVEVYNGPLSLDPTSQLGELEGYFIEAESTMVHTQNFVVAVAASQGLPVEAMKSEQSDAAPTAARDQPYIIPRFDLATETDARKWCKNQTPAGLFSQMDFFNCEILRALYFDAESSLTEIEAVKTKFSSSSKLNPLTREKIINVLRQISKVSAEMRAKALRWSVASTAGQSFNFKIRIAIVHFIVAAAEISNQIQSRSDALLKQLSPDGHDRRELPLSVFLRDVQPTEYIHFYKWLGASIDESPLRGIAAWIEHIGPVEERIKVLDRLFAGGNWSKINTVHASGRGKVQMALIKDEVGNWSLKGFDNDPGKLLAAYTDVAQKALEQAAKLAQESTTGGSGAAVHQLIALANQTAFAAPNTSQGEAGTLNLSVLHSRMTEKLTSQAKSFDSKDKELSTAYVKSSSALKTAKDTGADTADLQKAADKDKKALVDYRTQAVSALKQALDDHSDLVNLLSKSLVAK